MIVVLLSFANVQDLKRVMGSGRLEGHKTCAVAWIRQLHCPGALRKNDRQFVAKCQAQKIFGLFRAPN